MESHEEANTWLEGDVCFSLSLFRVISGGRNQKIENNRVMLSRLSEASRGFYGLSLRYLIWFARLALPTTKKWAANDNLAQSTTGFLWQFNLD